MKPNKTDKQTFRLVLCFIFLTLFLSNATPMPSPAKTEAEKRAIIQEIYLLYHRKDYTNALERVEKGLKAIGSTQELLQLKYHILMDQKKYPDALAFIDHEIQTSGETEVLLAARYTVLYAMENWKGALDTALKKEKMTKIKSPWDCLNLVHVFIQMGRKDEALDWLDEAARRGFTSYRILADPKYALLGGDSRFYEIIEKIKRFIGLGEPAKDFTTALLSAENFTLSSKRGSVVVIFFWATWCEPCKAEIPSLQEYYNQFKDKGLEMVGINLDSNAQKMNDYIQQTHWLGKHAYSGLVWKDPIVRLYRIDSLPALRLVDKKGILRAVDLKGTELRKAIETLVAE
ncbi:MAG: redoxin domain-containing protein [Candidatus Omnitrophota bacterium]